MLVQVEVMGRSADQANQLIHPKSVVRLPRTTPLANLTLQGGTIPWAVVRHSAITFSIEHPFLQQLGRLEVIF